LAWTGSWQCRCWTPRGLRFYRDSLGHALRWRSDDIGQAGLALAGSQVVTEPFDIPVGRVAVVADPFGNTLVLLICLKGTTSPTPLAT
jgi:hypothetical protein